MKIQSEGDGEKEEEKKKIKPKQYDCVGAYVVYFKYIVCMQL